MSIALMCGDCLELMKQLPDKSVDLTVTSPPYDNLRTYNGNISQWSFEKFKEIAKELYRITNSGGVVVWVVGDATIKGSETGTSFRQALWFMDCGFNLHDTMIYQKSGVSYPESNRYLQQFEYMFVFSKWKPKTCNLIKDRENKYVGKQGGNHRGGLCNREKYGLRFNIWYYPNGKYNSTKYLEAFKHPAIFPERLATDHILSWSNEGDTVLDCMMGSGTTGVACVNTNRNFIGMELDPRYFELAKKRIQNAMAKMEVQDERTD